MGRSLSYTKESDTRREKTDQDKRPPNLKRPGVVKEREDPGPNTGKSFGIRGENRSGRLVNTLA